MLYFEIGLVEDFKIDRIDTIQGVVKVIFWDGLKIFKLTKLTQWTQLSRWIKLYIGTGLVEYLKINTIYTIDSGWGNKVFILG